MTTKLPDLNMPLEEIPHLPFDELRALYTYLIGGDTKSTRKEFYILRITHRLQELRFGGLNSKTKRLLETMDKDEIPDNRGVLPVGAEIIKKYMGQTYRLRIVAGGYEVGGKVYKSLSGAAFGITGRKIYGQTFFGV